MKKFHEIIEEFGGIQLKKAVWGDKEYYLVPEDALKDVIEAIYRLKYLWISDPGTAAHIDKETDRIIRKLIKGEGKEDAKK